MAMQVGLACVPYFSFLSYGPTDVQFNVRHIGSVQFPSKVTVYFHHSQFLSLQAICGPVVDCDRFPARASRLARNKEFRKAKQVGSTSSRHQTALGSPRSS